jgi:hypothetical protein
MDTKALQFLTQPDWAAGCTVDGGGNVTSTGAKNASIARVSQGIFDVTLGGGGIDSGHREIHVDQDVSALLTIVDTDNDHKRITFRDAAAAVVDPTRFMVTIRRLALS